MKGRTELFYFRYNSLFSLTFQNKYFLCVCPLQLQLIYKIALQTRSCTMCLHSSHCFPFPSIQVHLLKFIAMSFRQVQEHVSTSISIYCLGTSLRPKKNICLFKLSCQNKIGSVGRKIFLFF